jgi:hypothetical protein
LRADYRGPIRKGDLDIIAPPVTVIIIDGALNDAERLPMSEAEHALRRGLILYGAASTGALLAIELQAASMKGFGRVFEFLRQFVGDPEDLVSLLYLTGENEPLTVPLINIILAYQDLGFGEDRLHVVSRTLAAIPLHDRVWDTIALSLGSIGLHMPSSIRFANAKADDARALLGRFKTELQTDGSNIYSLSRRANASNTGY